MTIDYYFDNLTGVLIAENFHLYRYDSYPYEERIFNIENLYVNRTLSSINEYYLIDSDELNRSKPDSMEQLGDIIITSAFIGVFAVLFYLLYRKKRKFTEQVNDSNS